jgi:ABC-2 type transport system permease protein
MTTESSAPHAAQPHGWKEGLRTHLVNVYRLAVKELRSIRADPMMLVLVAYTFTVAVYTVATGASTEAKDLTVGVVDEDNSDLSRRLLNALNPPLFKSAVLITANEIDANMNDERLIFVLEIPPDFQSDLLAGRQASLQLNVDATAMAQAGNGSVYIKSIIAQEIANFQAGRDVALRTPGQCGDPRQVQPEPVCVLVLLRHAGRQQHHHAGGDPDRRGAHPRA